MAQWQSGFRAALLLTAAALIATAQDPRGAVTGRVVDVSEAVIPGVEVRATNVETGVSAATTTNEVGKFDIPYLLSGFYTITAEAPGFKRFVRDNVQVRIGERVELEIRMEVGAVTETVEVTAETPLLETTSASLGQVIDERRVLELPLLAGNPTELVLLTPGVINGTNMRLRKPAWNAGLSQFATDGNERFNNEFQIDGVTNTFAEGRRPRARVAFSPPSTAIKEFKMQTTTYDASYGHTIGSVVNVSTKSGTNEFHGEVHWWVRNQAFDAPNFFNNKRGTKPPVYQDNRYGASAGGPVYLPKLYDGRNKTFWHYAWEANKWGVPKTFTRTVPTAAQREGDFSRLLGLGSRYQIYDPFSTRESSKPGRFERDPFPGNVIPPSLLDPLGQNLVKLYPLPNIKGTKTGRNNLFIADKGIEDYYVQLVRVDHTFNDKLRMFVRFHYDWWEEDKRHDLGVDVIANGVILNRINRGAALDFVNVFSPTLVFNFRYGLTNQEFAERRRSRGMDLASLGFSQNLIRLLADPSLMTLPRIRPGSFAGLSTWESGDGANTSLTHSFVGAFTKIQGKHTMKFGADIRFYRSFGLRIPRAIAPDYYFGTTYTRGPYDNSPSAPIGQGLASMLLGIPGGSMERTATSAMQDQFYAFYLHDDWKVTNRLTLNLGLRYELELPITERFDRLVAGYAFDESNPIEAQARANYAQNPIPELPPEQFRVLGGLTWVATGGLPRSPFAGEKNNFMPRIGFAYRLDDKTTLRGGYGMFFDTIGVNKTVAIQTGFTQSTPIQASLDNGLSFVATTADPFPEGLLEPLGPAGGLETNLGQSLNFYYRGRKHAYSQRWSLGFQRILPGQFLLEASYVGNRGTRLGVNRPLNNTPRQYLSTKPFRDQETIDFLTETFPNPFRGLNPIYGTTITREQLLKPYPHFKGMTWEEPIGYSWYHSLQVRAERRLRNGFTFQVAYTFSKLMEAVQFLNATDPAPYESIARMDRPHRLAISGIWEIPVGRGRRFGTDMNRFLNGILGGWQIGAVIVRQSGAPLGFGNAIFTGDIKNIPLPKGQRDVDRWFNVDAGFERNAKKQLSRNIRAFPLRFSGVRGDGQDRWDFSLIKRFPITERINLQFRAEVYNALNTVSFNNPRTNPYRSDFGRITATQVDARNWQFALRLNW